MIKNIPYKYYKTALVAVWIFALLCLIGTWLGFSLSNDPSMVFAVIVDIFLTASIAMLAALLFMSGRPDYKKKGWIVALLDLIHTAFFITVLVLGATNATETIGGGTYVWPIVHTFILVGIVGFGIYFSIRDRFVFKNPNEHDAVAAFGGPINTGATASKPVEQPGSPIIPETPVQPEPPKPARDEKTGIVSL